jgi:hypothetical protein
LEYFNDKVNFLLSEIAVIEADDAAFLKFGHSLRNEAYHKETYRYDVIIPATQTYLGIVCRLYPLIRAGGFTWPLPLPEAESEFLKRYAISGPFEFSSKDLERICDEVAAKRDCDPSQLAAALSRNLVRRLKEILGTDEETGLLEYLARESTEDQTSIDDVLRRIMFVDSYVPETGPPQTDEGFRRAIERWESEFAKFRPAVSVKTLRRWRQTAQSLASENNPGKVAERYTSIDLDFSPIEELVHQAVAEFDEWVNNEVDRMRGN